MESQPSSNESSMEHDSSEQEFSLDFNDSNILKVLSGIQFQSWLTYQSRLPLHEHSIFSTRRATNVKAAIVFTDVVESTHLLYELGDYAYRNCLKNHFLRVRSLIKTSDGYEINSMGDGFLCIFANSINAINFALDLQENTGDARVSVRVGIHWGEILTNSTEVGGKTIHFASRVLNHASDADICISDAVKQQLSVVLSRIEDNLIFLDEDSKANTDVNEANLDYLQALTTQLENGKRIQALPWKEYPESTLKGIPGSHTLWQIGSA